MMVGLQDLIGADGHLLTVRGYRNWPEDYPLKQAERLAGPSSEGSDGKRTSDSTWYSHW